jgi:hypothetical protein
MLAMVCCTAVVDFQARQKYLESDPWDYLDRFESITIFLGDEDLRGGSFVFLDLPKLGPVGLFEHVRHLGLILVSLIVGVWDARLTAGRGTFPLCS